MLSYAPDSVSHNQPFRKPERQETRIYYSKRLPDPTTMIGTSVLAK